MAKYRDPKLRISSAYARQRRKIRRPQHPFLIQQRPFQIVPFLLSPVIPGETMKNALVQSRTVTNPIKHPLIGWWLEHYLFYVRLVDIEYHEGHDDFRSMLLDPSKDMSAHVEAANQNFYHPPGGINWTQKCLETVTEWFFRDEGEDWDEAMLGAYPMAQISGRSWLDSLTRDSEKRTDREVNLDMDGDGNITVREMLEAQQHWQAIREAGLEDMDYEDYIRTYGIQVRQPDTSPTIHRPEVLRYSREWQYPTNIVDPATGVPSSAVSWAVAFRADKDRFFKEPGFIFGASVARPKVYLADTVGSLIHMSKSVYSWLPAVLADQYEKGFLEIPHAEGPLAGRIKDDALANEDYWVDVRDAFTHGDQFTNLNPTQAEGFLSIVKADGSQRYPNDVDIDKLFTSAEKNVIRQDGIVTFAIAGRITDNTPSSVPL